MAALLFAAIAGAGSAVSSQQHDPTLVRARLHACLNAYEPELSTLIADEHFEQWPLLGGLIYGVSPGTYRRNSARLRTIDSTVAFVSLPANAGWLGFRDVQRVTGRGVRRTGPALAELLGLESDDAHARAIALLLGSAQHNLGAPRTINLPSLPLELLQVRNEARFVIETSSRERIGDCEAIRIDLTETVTPTLIQRPAGGDMPSRVPAWVEPSTGRLCKAEVRTHDAQHGVSRFEAAHAGDLSHPSSGHRRGRRDLSELPTVPDDRAHSASRRARALTPSTYAARRTSFSTCPSRIRICRFA